MNDKVEDKVVRIHEVKGVEGNSLYINDYRVAGSKPWGGGVILSTWLVPINEIVKAIGKELIAFWEERL